VVSGAGVGEADSRVLDMLEFIEEVGWYAVDSRGCYCSSRVVM